MEPRLHRSKADVEQDGRLLERQAVQVVEDDDAAVLLRQAGHAVADDLAQLRLLGALGGLDRPVRQQVGGGILDRLRLRPATGEPGVAEVQRHAVQPRQRRDVDVQGRPALVGPGERVLEDLLGRVRVAGQAVGRAVDRGAVANEELLERVELVGLHPAQELRVRTAGGFAGRLARRCPVVIVRRSPGSDHPRSVRARHLRARHRPPAQVGVAGGGRLVEALDRRGVRCRRHDLRRRRGPRAAISISASANASSVSSDSVSVGSMSMPSSTMSGK